VTAVRIDRLGTYFILCTFSLLALYPVLSILFLALHRKSDLVSGFAIPTRIDLSSFEAAWTAAAAMTSAISIAPENASPSMACVPGREPSRTRGAGAG